VEFPAACSTRELTTSFATAQLPGRKGQLLKFESRLALSETENIKGRFFLTDSSVDPLTKAIQNMAVRNSWECEHPPRFFGKKRKRERDARAPK
jgi:hypothetical protein